MDLPGEVAGLTRNFSPRLWRNLPGKVAGKYSAVKKYLTKDDLFQASTVLRVGINFLLIHIQGVSYPQPHVSHTSGYGLLVERVKISTHIHFNIYPKSKGGN